MFKHKNKKLFILPERGISHILVPVLLVAIIALFGGFVYKEVGRAATPVNADYFQSSIANKCLDDAYDGKANYTKVQLYTCNKSAAQQWTVNTNGTIENANGTCLDLSHAQDVNNTKIVVYTCNTNAAQQWRVSGNTLVNPESNKCIDDPYSNTTNGTQLILYTCKGAANQEWTPVSANSTPTGSGTTGSTTTGSGGTTTTSSANFYGVNWHPIWMSDSAQDADITLMQEAGIKSVRIDAEWSFMEAQSGVYNPTYMERLTNAVTQLDAKGIDPLIVITSTPTWVSGAPSGDSTASAEPPVRSIIGSDCDASTTICKPYNGSADFDTFLTYLMKEWSGKVNEYEIWNEPDGNWSWKTTESNYLTAATNDAMDYTTLLKGAYTTAKAIDPSVTILGGALSGTALAQQTFLKTMYAQGAKNYFDVYSQHYYCDPPGHNYCNATRTVDDPATVADTFTNDMYPIMKANGDGSKPVWVTETGYNSESSAGGVSEAQQATDLTASFVAAKTLPSVARLYWYEMDCSDSGASYQNYYCLVENATTLKPSFVAYKNMTAAK
jgi:hypothetical protein